MTTTTSTGTTTGTSKSPARSAPTARGTTHRSRWAAIGAALAVSVGAGGLMSASATIESGERATYVPITPCRIIDTRSGTDNVGPRATPLGAGETYSTQVRGANGNCNIPADAVGLVMNLAVVNPTGSSFLTVFPTDQARPLAASVNWVANQPPVSNAITTDIAADGQVSFYNLSGTVNISADIVGYYADHNHDDRYYTKQVVDIVRADDVVQRDAAIAAAVAPKMDKPVGAQVLHVDAAAFIPNSNVDAYDLTGGDLRSTGAPFQAQAAVQLPNGATVIAVTARVFDNDVALNTSIELVRNAAGVGGFEQMALAVIAGQPGNISIATTGITNGVIDNTNFTYRLQTFSISPLNRLYDATIVYTLP